jgi:hypothetical protein
LRFLADAKSMDAIVPGIGRTPQHQYVGSFVGPF